MNFTFLKKYGELLVGTLFFLFIFWLLIIPLNQGQDVWFDVKLGEIFSKLGIIHYDVFSYTTKGREFFPYEWLFQIVEYQWQQLFGFEAIKYFIAFGGTLFIGGIYAILRRIFAVNVIFSMLCCFVFCVTVYMFFGARPYMYAYAFLVWNLFFILLYFFKGKNYLWITLPVTIIWANIHGSIFLDVLLFAGYTMVSLVIFFFSREKEWFSKTKVFSLYTGISTLLTILPPLGILQYRLLWLFFIKRDVLTSFVGEWNPTGQSDLSISVAASLLVILPLLFLSIRKKQLLTMMWVVPLLPLLVSGYVTQRNLVLTWVAIILIAGWTVGQIRFEKLSPLFKGITVLIALALLVHFGQMLSYVKLPTLSTVPVNATAFIKHNHLKGNMFNDFNNGGYMMYQLYPQQKVFIDGLTDLYLCCEIPYLVNLYDKTNLPNNQFAASLNVFWNTYDISYAELPTTKATPARKIEDVLTNDPHWSLVFWDDNAEIFVRKDGKNNDIIKTFGTAAATPYSYIPYRDGQNAQAFKEYQRMIAIADSAKSRNAIGFILAQEGKYDEARTDFEKSIALNPTLSDVYENLAEIYVKEHDYQKAIDLYRNALSLDPGNSFLYFRIGQIYAQGLRDTSDAKEILQEALQQGFDGQTNARFQNIINSLQ